MSDPTLSDIYFANKRARIRTALKLAWVWTTLKPDIHLRHEIPLSSLLRADRTVLIQLFALTKSPVSNNK